MFHIEAPASTIEELERNMRLNEDILRYLTVKIDELPEGPSVMMTARPDRPRRTDRYEDNVSVKEPYDEEAPKLMGKRHREHLF